jgi:hypothetical protein
MQLSRGTSVTGFDETSPVIFEERLVSSLAQADALSKLLAETGIITNLGLLNPTSH